MTYSFIISYSISNCFVKPHILAPDLGKTGITTFYHLLFPLFFKIPIIPPEGGPFADPIPDLISIWLSNAAHCNINEKCVLF